MEHTNAAKRPVITINYGYVLPSTLFNGGMYAFQNYETGMFMAVQSGTDANDVNVITEWVPEDEITYELENRHYFKLEYIPSTGAYYLRAMCSSNGTNRVLDIHKYNGYPDYGSNVQIYTPTDPLAQHWLIIATGQNRCKIVLRNAPGLLLTEDIPMENVELRTNEDEWYQEWIIYDDDGHTVDMPYNTSIDDDIYYFNNLYHGKYLHNGNGTANATSGLIEDLEDTIRWKVTHVGNNTYTIQSMDDMSKYLRSVDSLYVELSTPTTLSNEYLWRFTKLTSNEYLIQNVATSKYLRQYTGSSLTSGSALGNPGTRLYNECVWRTVSQSNYAGRELTNSFSINDVVMEIGEFKTLTINKAPSNAIWSSTSDFIYSYVDTGCVTFENGVFTGCNAGITKIIATHRPTNLQFTFYAVVGETPLLIINNYVDKGYRVRFEDYPDVSEYCAVVCGKLEELFGLHCYITCSTITSSADICKIQQFGAVTAGNLFEQCPHDDEHLTRTSLYYDVECGTTSVVNVLWTGHILENNVTSAAALNLFNIVMTPANVVEDGDKNGNGIYYETSSVSVVRKNSIQELMHELSHQLGTPDHYCCDDGTEESEGKCSNKNCDICVFEETAIRPCLMSDWNIDVNEDPPSAWYCSSCFEIIEDHLSNHHQ